MLFKDLDDINLRFEEIKKKLQDVNVINNKSLYHELMKEFSEISPTMEIYGQFKDVIAQIKSNQELIAESNDPELTKLAKEEITSLKTQKQELEQSLKEQLVPKDPNDDKNIILEMRAGAGGDEASLFTEELFRAYGLFATSKKWKVDVISISEGNAGGYKEVIATLSGNKVFSKLKYESGVHRVQRVPKTESQGRIHTSTITVAVLPEADEVDVKIDPEELKIDVYRSSGSGGQHVNTTDSAVRITHIPSKIVVSCQDEKSQLKNKNKAMKVLYARLLDLENRKLRESESEKRLHQIGTGDRSERIRTYNFPQSRITDHRVGYTTKALANVMNGQMEDLIDHVATYYQAQALKDT